VRNGTDLFPDRYHPIYMLDNKLNAKRPKAKLASITKETANPRMARAAKFADLNGDRTRIPESPKRHRSAFMTLAESVAIFDAAKRKKVKPQN
jgi:hypothetical protein